MDQVSAEMFMRDQIPLPLRAMIPSTLRNAYAAVKHLVDGEPILNVCSAEDNRGRIVTWAVDHAFETLLKSGKWPFDYSWQFFEKPTGRYLEIRPSHSVLTISQIDDPAKQPRDVGFRANKRLSNQPFFDLEEFKEERLTQGRPHFLLIHGHQTLNFAHLGVPHATNVRSWLYKTPDLLTMPHVVESDLPPVEPTEFEAVMLLKEEIERWQNDHAG